MFNNVVLDVFIGLVFVFLLYSLLATIVQEMIAHAFGMRPRMLLKALMRMLEDGRKTINKNGQPEESEYTGMGLMTDTKEAVARYFKPFEGKSFLKSFYDHPTIKFLGESRSSSKPSYISAANFSQTLIHLLRGEMTDGGSQMEAIKKFLDNPDLPIPPDTLKHLRLLYTDATGDIDRFKQKLENWFEETMQRASGWYKRQTQWLLFAIGLGIAIIFNVNTISIYRTLAKDKTIRDQIVKLAIEGKEKYAPVVDSIRISKKAANADSSKGKADSTVVISYILSDSVLKNTYDTLRKDEQEVSGILALGWDNNTNDTGGWLRFFGWLLTAIAVSLGAPFWFDTLSKLIKLRATGPKPDETKSNTTNSSNTSSPLQRVG